MPDNISPELKKVLELFNTDKIITQADIDQILSAFADMFKKFKKDTDSLNEETKKLLNGALKQISDSHNKTVKDVTDNNTNSQSEISQEVGRQITIHQDKVETIIKKVLAKIPKDGKDADESRVIKAVLKEIKSQLPKPQVVELDTGEDIVDKINALNDDEDNKIDAKHIKNLPKPVIQKITKGGSGGGSTAMRVTSDTFVVKDDRTYAGHKNISIPIQPTPPENPFEGMLWIDNS